MPEAEVVNTVANGNEATASPMLKINIVEQIEYYFGDFNLMKDKFLKQEIQKDDGWVPLATLLNFNRLAALTKDVDVIVSAFKENPSELVEIDNARKCVRRHPDRALPEHDETWRHSIAQRTVYVKGFPTETTTLDEILKFMQTFGKIDNVSKRNYYDKTSKSWKFKGSIYAAFPNREEAEKFISIKSVKYAGNELIRKLQIDYIEQKKQERMEHKMKAQKMKDDLLKEQQEGKKKELKKLPTGALIHVSGLTSDINRNQLKDAAKALGWDVAFVDHNKEDNTAYIRLQGQDSAKEALSKLENNSFEVEKTILKAEVVEGEKETELLKKMEDDKNHLVMQNFMKSKKGKKFKTGKKFSRRGNYGSEKDSNDDDQPSRKDDASEAAQKNDVSEKNSEESCPIKRKLNEELEETAKKSKANDE